MMAIVNDFNVYDNIYYYPLNISLTSITLNIPIVNESYKMKQADVIQREFNYHNLFLMILI